MTQMVYKCFIDRIGENENEALSSGLEFIGAEGIINKNDVLFIKPNLTYPDHITGVTSRPEHVEHVIDNLLTYSNKIIVGESNGGNRSFSANQSLERHGIYKICKARGIECVNLSETESVIVEEEVQGRRIWVELPRLLLEEVDHVVSSSVLKVHAMTQVTMCIKNLWGCYPNTMRCLHHEDYPRKIGLILRKLQPSINIIDGKIGLTGHGPMYGDPINTDLIIVSNNAVVSDYVGSMVMNVNLKKNNHILFAEKMGLGTTDIRQIEMNRHDIQQFVKPFRLKRTINDYCSFLLFNSEMISRLVMQSKLKPLFYGISDFLKNSEEEKVSTELRKEEFPDN